MCVCRWHNRNAWRQIWCRTEDFPWLLELIACAWCEMKLQPIQIGWYTCEVYLVFIRPLLLVHFASELLSFGMIAARRERADSHYQTAIIYFPRHYSSFLPPDGTGEREAHAGIICGCFLLEKSMRRGIPKHASARFHYIQLYRSLLQGDGDWKLLQSS